MVESSTIQIAVECGELKGRNGYTRLGAVWVTETRAGAGPEYHPEVAIWAMSRRLTFPGAGGIFLDPADARRLAAALLDVAKAIDGEGLTSAQTEECVGLVGGVLDRWGEPFENDNHVSGADLVDWMSSEFFPGAFGALKGRSQCA